YCVSTLLLLFFFSSRRRHTRSKRDWSSDVCSSDLDVLLARVRAAEKETERLRTDQLLGSAAQIAAAAKDIEGTQYVAHHAEGVRSEERRVGKECRAGRAAQHEGREEEEETCKRSVI